MKIQMNGMATGEVVVAVEPGARLVEHMRTIAYGDDHTRVIGLATEIPITCERATLYANNLFEALHRTDRSPTVTVEIQMLRHVERTRDHFALAVDQIAWHLELSQIMETHARARRLNAWWRPSWNWAAAERLLRDVETRLARMRPFPRYEPEDRDEITRLKGGTIDVAALEPGKPIPVVACHAPA